MFLLYRSQGERRFGLRPHAPHVRKAWAFQVIMDGTCSLLVRENKVTHEERITGPVFSIIGPDVAHSWGGKKTDICHVMVLHFDEAYPILCSLIGEDGRRFIRISKSDLPTLQALYDQCNEARRTPGFASEKTHEWYKESVFSGGSKTKGLPPSMLLEARTKTAYFAPLIYAIVAAELTLFFLKHISSGELGPAPDFAENKVAQAMAWYQANLASQPNIKDVAHAVYLSATHLRRLFHKVRGMSPQEAFTRAQFERVKWLMRDSIPFERIAEICGFGSASAFSRAFKMTFGVSPREYRTRLQSENLPPRKSSQS
jgi:AraC-like DNA-binding protein